MMPCILETWENGRISYKTAKSGETFYSAESCHVNAGCFGIMTKMLMDRVDNMKWKLSEELGIEYLSEVKTEYHDDDYNRGLLTIRAEYRPLKYP